MAITCDYVLNDILKTLPSIPFALLSAKSIDNPKEEYAVRLYCSWLYQMDLFSENAVHVKEIGKAYSLEESHAMIIKLVEQMKLRIYEAVIVYDADFQIMNAYHFDPSGNVNYTFNSIRCSRYEVGIEYDLFTAELNDKDCLRDYQAFISAIQEHTCAQRVVLKEPGLLEVIRKNKLERILRD